MPVLAQEASVYPADLLVSELPSKNLNGITRGWWAVYTRSRQEKAVARELYRYEVPFYLPLIPTDRIVRGRRIRSYLPMFPGYLFLFGTEDERLITLKTNRISRILPVNNEDRLREDLLQVNKLIEMDAPLSLERRLEAGQRGRIKSGSFKGFEGTIIRRKGLQRLVVHVDFLAQGVSIEVEDAAIELV